MKKLSLTLLVLVLTVALAGVAGAKEWTGKPMQPYQPNGRAAEVEPNDTPAEANVLTVGDDMSAAIDVAGDFDYFAITVAAGDILTFETLPGDADDTRMWLYDTDGTTELVFNDDGGQGFYSLIADYEFAAAGTYYIAISHYSSSGTGTYILTATETVPPEPQPNDLCEGAIDVTSLDQPYDEFDLCLYNNDYDPGSDGCTGFIASGPDAVYVVDLAAGQEFFASAEPLEGGFTDLSIYLVTDCADLTSCVAGSDAGNPEQVAYTSVDGGTYYLIIDSYTNCGSGLIGVTFEGVVQTEASSLTEIKALFD
jgi:hypothetical protein